VLLGCQNHHTQEHVLQLQKKQADNIHTFHYASTQGLLQSLATSTSGTKPF
jgi:hypothetical protein